MRVEPIAAALRSLGAAVDVRETGDTILPEDVARVHVWVSGWIADYPDPEGLFHGLFESGWPLLRDPDALDLLERSRHERDPEARMETFHEIDRLWVGERAAIVPILYHRSLLLRRPWVDGVWANPMWGLVLDSATVHRSV
ncbi:MAG: hypothetical protein FJW96_02250 [Actinobacteria bacterium]|nr:hypothetical protein [Actinomycetota bacterium]